MLATARLLGALAALAAALACGPGDAQAQVAQVAYVDVAVTTLWVRPSRTRPIDRPSLTNPVNMDRWAGRMTTPQRRWLVGRLETQALYGTRVLVVGHDGAWAKIVVPSQSTPRDSRGYPGWVPAGQLTTNTILDQYRSGRFAVVVARKTWLRTTGGAKALELSFGTRLAVVGSVASGLLIEKPTGGSLVVSRSAVAVYRNAAAIPRPSPSAIVASAMQFLGLRYLWGGVSSWGFDCSGLTYAVYRRYGIAIPRDADAQATAGSRVDRARLRAGDLVFFAGAGGTGHITHVAIYAGGGTMVEAPNSASSVRVVPLQTRIAQFAGARRYL